MLTERSLIGGLLLLAATLPARGAEAELVPGERSPQGWRVMPRWMIMFAEMSSEMVFPMNLEEALKILECDLDSQTLRQIDEMKSPDELVMFHHGLGTGIRNDFVLWGGSELWGMAPLKVWMNERGITHPDEMSSLILCALWAKRRGQPYEVNLTAGQGLRTTVVKWAGPPERLRDPLDGAAIIWTTRAGLERDGDPREAALGVSTESRRLVAYEYDRGVYTPDMTVLMRFGRDASGEKVPVPETLEEAYATMAVWFPGELLAEIDACDSPEALEPIRKKVGPPLQTGFQLRRGQPLREELERQGMERVEEMTRALLVGFWKQRRP